MDKFFQRKTTILPKITSSKNLKREDIVSLAKQQKVGCFSPLHTARTKFTNFLENARFSERKPSAEIKPQNSRYNWTVNFDPKEMEFNVNIIKKDSIKIEDQSRKSFAKDQLPEENKTKNIFKYYEDGCTLKTIMKNNDIMKIYEIKKNEKVRLKSKTQQFNKDIMISASRNISKPLNKTIQKPINKTIKKELFKGNIQNPKQQNPNRICIIG